MFVDGTVLPTWTPSNPKRRRNMWNNKHHMSAFTFFILVCPDGRIAYVSKVDIGSRHDKTAWDNSDIVSRLEEAYPEPTNGWSFGIGADKAYPNMHLPKHFEASITKSGEDGNVPKQPGVHFTPKIAKHRSVVERTIGVIKSWGILNNIAAVSQSDCETEVLVHIVCALVNKESYN